MSRPKHTEPDTFTRVARAFLAALLACVTLAGATRADALLGATTAAADCCAAMGGASKDSCPFMRLKARARATKLKESDPICGAHFATTAHHEASHAQRVAQHAAEHVAQHAAKHVTHHAASLAASHAASLAASHAASHVASHVASLSTSLAASHVAPKTEDASAVPSASISKPCSSDCCRQVGSLARNQRTGDPVAISQNVRTRAPARAPAARAHLTAPVFNSASRRLGPPRAPPASL